MKSKNISRLDRNFDVKAAKGKGGRLWVDAFDRRLEVRGLAWQKENGKRFCRLPLRARKLVRSPVWDLSQCPASARICFRSDTSSLVARARLGHASNMCHMPATGQSGLALYAGEPGRMKRWGVGIPDIDKAYYERELFSGAPRKMREYAIYLPLYNSLTGLKLGFDADARFAAPSRPAIRKPAVFYGTSITQGGCACTTGADWVSTVGRLLDLDAINLGFSGNGKGEPEMARLIAEIDASLFVLDYAANVSPEEMRNTLPEFCRILRREHPRTPILLVSKICYGQEVWSDERRTVHDASRDAIIQYYAATRQAGDENIHFADGMALLPCGVDAATVDGVHPTDHGFQMIAERIAPYIERILRVWE
ncbi:MAG: SGNH/GDSL hydrolase family protein [Verrucomicrobiae bacterium]|nr:SGNH/GDSL hydrolase family protein [Verrucomicrobiae bacterium]